MSHAKHIFWIQCARLEKFDKMNMYSVASLTISSQ